MDINAIKVNNKDKINQIADEFITNYKDEGYIIIGGKDIGGLEKCFIGISKKDTNKLQTFVKRWYFNDCKDITIVVSIANELMDNLK